MNFNLPHSSYRVNLPDALSFVRDLQDVFAPAYKQALLRETIRRASFHHDVEGGWGALPFVFRKIAEDRKNVRGKGSPATEFGVEIRFFADPGGTGDYAILYTQQNSYVEAWEALGWVTPFPVHVGGLRPDSIPTEVWDIRRSIMRRTATGSEASSSDGLLWGFSQFAVDPHHLIAEDPENAAGYIPTNLERARNTIEGGQDFRGDTGDVVADWVDKNVASLAEKLPTLDLDTLGYNAAT